MSRQGRKRVMQFMACATADSVSSIRSQLMVTGLQQARGNPHTLALPNSSQRGISHSISERDCITSLRGLVLLNGCTKLQRGIRPVTHATR